MRRSVRSASSQVPRIPRIAVAQPGGGVAVRGPCPWSAAPARRCSNFCPIPPGQELPALLLLFLLLSPLPPSPPFPCPPGALFPGSFSSQSPPGGVGKRRRAWGAEGGGGQPPSLQQKAAVKSSPCFECLSCFWDRALVLLKPRFLCMVAAALRKQPRSTQGYHLALLQNIVLVLQLRANNAPICLKNCFRKESALQRFPPWSFCIRKPDV